jgi:hypothetical protein
MTAPAGRLRRRILFGMSKRAARRDDRSLPFTQAAELIDTRQA